MQKMKHYFSGFLIRKIEEAFTDSYRFINHLVMNYRYENLSNKLKIVDVGCEDGHVSPLFVRGINNYLLYGLDIQNKAKGGNIIFRKCNLETDKFPFRSNSLDIVIASQTIEHLLNKDHLLEESRRVLKVGGLFICATENIASFDNILSLLLGQEPLTQHTGAKYYSNSILSPHFMEKIQHKTGNKFLHKNVSSYYGLLRLFEINGFRQARIVSFGNINKVAEKIFKIYNRIIVGYVYKA